MCNGLFRFVPFKDNEDDDYECHENAAVFLVSAYQYIILSVTFSKGAPFRKSIFTNCESPPAFNSVQLSVALRPQKP